MSECCVRGSLWQGTPSGRETTLSKNKSYRTGSNKDVTILFIHDAYGWTFRNIRILADAYAKEVDATVYVPDFFGGEVLPPEILDDPSQWHTLDFPGFMARNSKSVREQEILACAQALRSQYKRVGAAGFCFGGWAVFRLGAKEHANLVNCISTAHPSLLEKSEIENVKVPVQIIAPEIDPQFTPGLKELANSIIPTLGVPYDYQYFPGIEHGFATKGDESKIAEYSAVKRAKGSMVAWFRLWLHEN
ncbi:alpha/beta-hydrolase [Mollisia scopiformis]|uniref:Alpha/beta-hydrolase n=1 Tax=Mollisia scopiformis TaxID=149040 RepID=A0A194WY50_MOLSC|nr:alpha/beta-hydrolase [Mollisia scopiformis]KUJ12522.1 alpha/beta-hydrolase [Mollisia scopiformis]